jgi:hypothetical protein
MLIEFLINSCVDCSAIENDERISTYLNERNGLTSFCERFGMAVNHGCCCITLLEVFLWVDFWVSYIETFPSSQVVACPILRLACSTSMMVPT